MPKACLRHDGRGIPSSKYQGLPFTKYPRFSHDDARSAGPIARQCENALTSRTTITAEQPDDTAGQDRAGAAAREGRALALPAVLHLRHVAVHRCAARRRRVPLRQFEAYWSEGERRSAWWAKVGGERAGFALVRLDSAEARHEVAEFFIVNRWRRRGVGLSFARQLMSQFPGPWKLHQLANNTAAIAFWHRVLAGFAPFAEAPLDYADGMGRIEQRFVVS